MQTAQTVTPTPKARGPISVSQGRNDKRLDTFIKEVRAYGATRAKGDLSLMSLAESSVRAAADGIIDADQAKLVWETFQKARSTVSADMFQEAKSFAMQVSKLKKLIEMGELGRDHGDGLALDVEDIFSRAQSAYKSIHADSERRKGLVGNVYENLVKVARAQIRPDARPVALTDEAINELLLPYKPETIKTEADFLEQAISFLAKLQKGGKGREPMPSQAALQSIGLLRGRVADLREAMLDDGPDVATMSHNAQRQQDASDFSDSSYTQPVEPMQHPVTHDAHNTMSKRAAKKAATLAKKAAAPPLPLAAPIPDEDDSQFDDVPSHHLPQDALSADEGENIYDQDAEVEEEEEAFAGFKAHLDEEEGDAR